MIIKSPAKVKQMQPLQFTNVTDRGSRQNPREKLARKPTSLRAAINAMCFDCNCEENWIKRTRECNIPKCPLYNVRPFQTSDNDE